MLVISQIIYIIYIFINYNVQIANTISDPMSFVSIMIISMNHCCHELHELINNKNMRQVQLQVQTCVKNGKNVRQHRGIYTNSTD